MKIVICVSGASGAHLGLLLGDELRRMNHDVLQIVSESAETVLLLEQGRAIDDRIIEAPSSSGSYGADATLIVPCSMNTLAKLACGIADTATTRAGAVALKERKKLLIAPREMPFDTIALENMAKLAQAGAIIAPPLLSYYAEQQTIADMEQFLIGRWLDLVGIPNNLFKRWGHEY